MHHRIFLSRSFSHGRLKIIGVRASLRSRGVARRTIASRKNSAVFSRDARFRDRFFHSRPPLLCLSVKSPSTTCVCQTRGGYVRAHRISNRDYGTHTQPRVFRVASFKRASFDHRDRNVRKSRARRKKSAARRLHRVLHCSVKLIYVVESTVPSTISYFQVQNTLYSRHFFLSPIAHTVLVIFLRPLRYLPQTYPLSSNSEIS